jgi:hypothetical protein
MAGTVAAGSALLLEKRLNAATVAASGPRLLVVDYDLAGAHELAREAASNGCRTLALTGDRVRLARDVFAADAPDVIGGITTYADFIVLTGCAAEAGYRVLSEQHTSTAASGEAVNGRAASSGAAKAVAANGLVSRGMASGATASAALVRWKVARLACSICS